MHQDDTKNDINDELYNSMQFGQARIPREFFLNIDFEFHYNIP